jgi:hypothetical protein
MGLFFKMAAGPRQPCHSQVRVPRDSWWYITVSDSRLHHPGGSRPRIYIPLEEGGPVISPGTGFHFRRLLRKAGLRWKFSTTPPHGNWPIVRVRVRVLYDWQFTAKQFVLAPSPLRLTARIFFSQLNTCGHSPYITSSLTRGWVCHLQFLLALASAFILLSESRGPQP